uniref:MYB family transcription factor n=1 Tax=Melilotus albus TaxID=47082 RepID=A0A896WCD8_MELAB|nr:MYB family transcription factor [Melilotus albus]
MSYYKRVDMNRNNKSNIVKGQWTVEEDRLLINLVEEYGLGKWSDIAQKLHGRMGKQCRERWLNHLRPDIKKDTWSEEEEKILMKAHGEIGNKWSKIVKMLPGRTENSIKNHWNATKRRQYSKRKYPRGSSTLLQDYIMSLNLDKNPPKDYTAKSSTNASAMENNISTVQAQSQNSTELLVPPSCDFDDIRKHFCFNENLFQDECSIDSLLDNMEIMERKIDCEVEEEMPLEITEESMLGVEVKKEVDWIEMFFSGQ